MKKKEIIIFLLFFLNSAVYGLNFDSPKLLKQKEISIAASSFLEDNLNFGFFLINNYGLFDGLNSVIRVGFTPTYQKVGNDMLYLGAAAKILIMERFGGTDNLTFKLGGHYKQRKNVMGMDFSLSLGSKFFKFDHYLGLNFDIDFIGNSIEYPGEFIFGIKFNPFQNKKDAMVIEAGIPVTSDKEYNQNNYKISFSYIFSF